MKVIGFVLNVLWLIFCGIWMAIGYAIAGIICFILIITIPFGTVPRVSASRAGRSALRFA
ncbi:hypothetical protein GCM10010193_12360 [Kitasatospora atroaurantiaca]|uniref:Inner membrane component-like transport protein n=1 Tax=Kitasatospora atroaurantiaca TaxID=285545 RepID=A0A561EQN0_9ACTN|nr:inner membrane component-like transport protein [Kitasatospora atroaurantiaca]